MQYQDIGCLHWLCQFGIFRRVPLQGTISYGDLASPAKVSEIKLKTIVRMAVTNGLFIEEPPNHIAHFARSELLQTNPSLHDWASFLTGHGRPLRILHGGRRQEMARICEANPNSGQLRSQDRSTVLRVYWGGPRAASSVCWVYACRNG